MTIEQRASEYQSKLASSFLGCPDLLEGGYNGYIVGATDQRKIDIEKACAWLYKSIPRIKEVYLDKDISERDKEDIINDFIKAIEK